MKTRLATIAEFCTTGTGGTPLRSLGHYYGGDIPWVKSGELRENLICKAEEFLTEEAVRATRLKIVPSGAILVAMYGATVGRVARLGIPATTNQAVCHVIPDARTADANYLYHCLRSKLPEFLARRVGGAQPNISQGIIRQTKILLPPLDQQRSVAAVLDKADALREKRRQAIKKLDKLLQSIFVDMFGNPISNPMNWPTVSLEDVAPDRGAIVDGPFGSSLKPESYVPNGVRVIRNFNIKDDYFDATEFKYVSEAKFSEICRSDVVPGDLLISTKGTVGNLCLMPQLDGEAVLSATGTVRLRLPKQSEINPEFLVSQMTFPGFKQYIRSFEAGSNQKYLNLSAIRRIRVFAPPKEKQEEFRKVKSLIKGSLRKMDDSLSRTEQLVLSLQQRAFNLNSLNFAAKRLYQRDNERTGTALA